jgi:chromate transport protein ChrA
VRWLAASRGGPYARYKSNPEVDAVLIGAGAAAVGLLLAVTVQIGARRIEKLRDWFVLIPSVRAGRAFFQIPLLPFRRCQYRSQFKLDRPAR